MIQILSRIKAQATTDGAGVSILRVAPADSKLLDPFLMLDELKAAHPDQIGQGFPPHPHRGFETITLVKTGGISHKDSMGNQGEVSSGGVQWMTAGSGVIHSEMPKPNPEGVFHGFQLWLNLPATQKMRPPEYADLNSEDTGFYSEHMSSLRVYAGSFGVNEHLISGPIGERQTNPHIAVVNLHADAPLTLSLPKALSSFVYVISGALELGEHEFEPGVLYKISHEGLLEPHTNQRCEFLILAGAALNEQVVKYGPFVMNSQEQIQQALSDYQNGSLVKN